MSERSSMDKTPRMSAAAYRIATGQPPARRNVPGVNAPPASTPPAARRADGSQSEDLLYGALGAEFDDLVPMAAAPAPAPAASKIDDIFGGLSLTTAAPAPAPAPASLSAMLAAPAPYMRLKVP